MSDAVNKPYTCGKPASKLSITVCGTDGAWQSYE